MVIYITIFRIILAFPTSYILYKDYQILAFFLILLGVLSDWLDGNLARRRKEESDLGALLDPFADKVFVLIILAVFLHKGEISLFVYSLIIFRELFISFLRSVAVEGGYIMKASNLGKAKTVFEFIAILLLSVNAPFGHLSLWIALILAYVSAFDYVLSYLEKVYLKG